MAANGFDDDQTRSFTALAAGTKVSHYKIISKIGAGGMGEVYLAKDTQLGRQVAIKFLPSHLSQDEAARARFTREAKAAAKLDHPNVVQVFEVGEFQDRPFFAMAHIEGKSLRDVIKDGKLSVGEAIEITKQICEGLHKAHESGIVHRDIKPGNIIIDEDNKARILDFGLATVVGEDKLTRTGSTLGTVGYMSPEQIEGKQVDHRSDLFSVGVILYEMLTGRRPFEGDTDAAVSHSVTHSNPEPIARYKSGTTGELQRIIEKALSKDPSLRYQHADGMLADLKGLPSGTAVKASARVRLWVTVAVIVVFAIGSYFILAHYRLSARNASKEWDNSVAVMVFRDLSPGHDRSYFCESMTEEIIGRLSNIKGLRVPSLQSMLRLKNSDVEFRAVGHDLQVAHILTGSVLPEGDSIRVRAQLVRADDDVQIWSARYYRELQSVFAIQEEISQTIAKVLEIELTGEETNALTRHETENLQAYNAYAQGRFFWRKVTLDATRRALTYFEEAIAYDSNYAAAWAGLADSWTRLTYFGLSAHSDALARARSAAMRAIELDSTLAEAHSALGFVSFELHDFKTALTEFETSLALDSNRAWSHVCYGVLMGEQMRRNDLLVAHLQKALSLDPLDLFALMNMGDYLDVSGRYDEAERYFQKIIQIVPENTFFRTWFSWHYYRAGQYGKAREQLEQAIRIEPDYWDLYYRLAQLLNVVGRPTEAREVFEGAIKKMPDSAGIWYQYGRFFYNLKGDIDAAVERWRRAVDLDSSYGDAYNMLAYAHAKRDDFDGALASVQKAIDVSPDNLNYIDTRADILYSFGHLDEAIESYRQFLSQLPNSMNTITDLGNAATFARRYDLADSAYNTLAEHTSVEYRGWGQFDLTRTLRHQGKFRETVDRMVLSEGVIREEVGASDQLGGLYWNRAQMYWEWLKDYDKALEDLDSLRQVGNQIDSRGAISSAELGRPLVYALAGKYDSSDYYWQRVDTATREEDLYTWQGYIQLAKGNADSAVVCLERCKIIRPPSTVDRAWLGMAYLANGQTTEAVNQLEQAVFRYDGIKGVFPGYAVWYRYQLARAYEAAGRKDEAIAQYETFLDIWKNADDGLESVEDAKKRLARLKGTI